MAYGRRDVLVLLLASLLGAMAATAWQSGSRPPVPEAPGGPAAGGSRSEWYFEDVRLSLTGEPGIDLTAVPVAVFPEGEHAPGSQARTERVALAGGEGLLSLTEGAYELWVGSGRTPTRQGPFIVPLARRFRVRTGPRGQVEGRLVRGGAIRIPRELGLPPASTGRRLVHCRSGDLSLVRWLMVGPPDSDDMVWPPLPEGEWEMDIVDYVGPTIRLLATVRRDEVSTATLRR